MVNSADPDQTVPLTDSAEPFQTSKAPDLSALLALSENVEPLWLILDSNLIQFVVSKIFK